MKITFEVMGVDQVDQVFETGLGGSTLIDFPVDVTDKATVHNLYIASCPTIDNMDDLPAWFCDEVTDEIHSCSTVKEVNQLAEMLDDLLSDDDHLSTNLKVINGLMEDCNDEFLVALSRYPHVKFWEGWNIEDLARDLAWHDEFGNIDPDLVDYLNYDAIINDFMGDYVVVDGGVIQYLN